VLGAVEVRDVVVVGDRLAAPALDDVDDLVGGALVGAFAGYRDAEVVDDDLRALVGQLDGLAPPDAVAGAGDDRDLAVQQPHLRVLLPALKTDVGVTVSRSFTRPSKRGTAHTRWEREAWPSTRASSGSRRERTAWSSSAVRSRTSPTRSRTRTPSITTRPR